MRQRGNCRPVRMAALDWLLELLGVAYEHKASRGLADREDIGQRHLSRLIDEKNVDCSLELGARPEPSGAGRQLEFAAAESSVDVFVLLGLPNRRALDSVRIFSNLLKTGQIASFLRCGLPSLLQEVADDLVRDCGHANPS